MANPFIAFDAAIQRHVDATAHFLMRTFGVAKSAVRLALFLSLALSFFLQALFPEQVDGFGFAGPAYAFVGFVVILCGVVAYYGDRVAEAAELVMSPVDAHFLTRGRFYKGLMWFLLASILYRLHLSYSLDNQRTCTLIRLVSWPPLMMLMYLGGTSSKLPPQELRLPVGERQLVPIPVRSRYRNDYGNRY